MLTAEATPFHWLVTALVAASLLFSYSSMLTAEATPFRWRVTALVAAGLLRSSLEGDVRSLAIKRRK